MVYWLLAVIAALIIVITVLGVKLFMLKKSVKEIEAAFKERLEADTNTLVCVSCRDKNILSLAGSINSQLRLLRKERHRFQQGDAELKNAVTNISHDLRTPLTAIFGYLELFEKEEKSPKAKQYLEIIGARCEALKQLVDELFRYSVILSADDDFKIEEVVINNLAQESLAGFYAVLKSRGITPEIIMPNKPVKCFANREGLSRVFSNILNNAVKYSGGDLFFELTEQGEIIFENTAAGLDEVQLGRLFDRFYTVETARNSTGLGLSISKTLVEKMNGAISAYYENNKLKIVIKLLLCV